MKLASKLLFLLFAFVMLTSCASMLNGKYQKVTVTTGNSTSKVYVDDQLAGTGSTVTAKLERDRSIKQIKIEREGYKPVYKVHYQNKKSPLYIMSWIPFGVLFYPPFMDVGPKAYNYDKTVNASSGNLKIKKRAADEKYIYLKNTAFDVKKEDIKIRRIRHRSFKKGKKNAKEIDRSKEDIKFDNSVFSDAVNEILKNNQYIDTTKTIFKSKTNTLYISSKITKVDFQNIYNYSARTIMDFLVTKIEIEWEIFDLYDQSKHKKTYSAESGEFAMKGDGYVLASIEDAITDSFYKFLDSKEIANLIKNEKEEKISFEQMVLKSGKTISNLDDAMNSTVTIKVKDGHGSGCVVSRDGYVVTNFHVVANNPSFTVIDRKGKEYKAVVIRQNESLDLALIKLEGAVFEHSYTIPSTKSYIVGDDVFVIGTPSSIELGQTLSKGIISGSRTFEKNTFIQTDASVNGGNSGGALAKKSGELIGIVNAKLSGYGVEGIGFSIPAELIQTGLFIKN